MKAIPDEYVQYAIEQCKIIQQIPSPTFQEQDLAAYILEQFSVTGWPDSAIDAAGNVLTRIPGIRSNHPIVLSAHMDTVHPLGTDLQIKETPQHITGPSIGDNSLGVACLLTILKYFYELKITPQQDIWLVANTCEEGLGDLLGMKAVVNRFKSKPAAYIILEGIGLGNLTTQGLSVKRYRVTFETNGGHSWGDFGKPSAIHEMVHTLEQIMALPIPQTCKTTMNIGKIEGGKSINSLAPTAFFEIDLRSEQNKVLQNYQQKILQIIESTQSDAVRVSYEVIGDRPGGVISPSHDLVKKALQACQAYEITSALGSGSTDANIPLSLGYPAICVRLTEGGHAHTAEEYIDLPPLQTGLSIVLYLLNLLWERQQPSRRPPGRKRY